MARQGSMFKLVITLIIAFIVITYTILNTRLLIKGPQVELFEIESGQTISDELVEIKGKATDISYISLNDRQIFIDENQLFNEKILLTNRVNNISIYARDKFGKTEVKKLVLIREKV